MDIRVRDGSKYPLRAAPVMPTPCAKKIDNKKKSRDRVLIRVRDYASWIEEGKRGQKAINGRRENERGCVHSRRHNRPHFPPSTTRVSSSRSTLYCPTIFPLSAFLSPASLCYLYSRSCSTRHRTASSRLSNHSS